MENVNLKTDMAKLYGSMAEDEKKPLEATKAKDLVGLPLQVKAIYTAYGKYGKYATVYAGVGKKTFKTYLSKSSCSACEKAKEGIEAGKSYTMEIVERQFQNKEGDIVHYYVAQFKEKAGE